MISICPQAKFDAAKTHYYTNPFTTVMWRVEEAVAFTKSLVATFRRSLNFSQMRPEPLHLL